MCEAHQTSFSKVGSGFIVGHRGVRKVFFRGHQTMIMYKYYVVERLYFVELPASTVRPSAHEWWSRSI